MERHIDRLLSEWKNDDHRKVLLLRGARQVGKTYSVRALGKTFPHYLEVNFEEEKPVKEFFKGSLNPEMLCQKLSAYFKKPVIQGKTLLFFDEIQSCPEALSSLRYFYEKMPRLHLIATGSLLEFALSQIPAQGVGRITSLYLYPMSFDEFLIALDERKLTEIKTGSSYKSPLDTAFHEKLIDYLKIFFIIGGMPEVVKEYVERKDLLACQKKINDLIETFKDDFAKYKNRSPSQRINEVFSSIVYQSGNKFKYSNVDSHSSHIAIKDALDMIVMAGLAIKVFHTSAQGLPLGAGIDSRKFKVILFDFGLYQKLLGLDISSIIADNNFTALNKGSLAELFVGLEIIKNNPSSLRSDLYYWHREKRASNAEVDYVIQKGNDILPVEVKSGYSGQMQSLRLFMQEHNSKMGIRVSLENFAKFEKIEVYPMYAVKNILQGNRGE